MHVKGTAEVHLSGELPMVHFWSDWYRLETVAHDT